MGLRGAQQRAGWDQFLSMGSPVGETLLWAVLVTLGMLKVLSSEPTAVWGAMGGRASVLQPGDPRLLPVSFPLFLLLLLLHAWLPVAISLRLAAPRLLCQQMLVPLL